MDRLAEEVRQRKLPIVPGARVSEVPVDQWAQPQVLVQLAREQETGIGGHRGSPTYQPLG
jgi:hypothetical protein